MPTLNPTISRRSRPSSIPCEVWSRSTKRPCRDLMKKPLDGCSGWHSNWPDVNRTGLAVCQSHQISLPPTWPCNACGSKLLCPSGNGGFVSLTHACVRLCDIPPNCGTALGSRKKSSLERDRLSEAKHWAFPRRDAGLRARTDLACCEWKQTNDICVSGFRHLAGWLPMLSAQNLHKKNATEPGFFLKIRIYPAKDRR